MEKKLILGISSSPRKNANTDALLARSLAAAEEYDFIRTETIYLRDYEIASCNACFACCTEEVAKKDAERACFSFRDGMDELYPKLLECSGMILAAPVYFGSANAPMKAFMDRTEGLLRYGMSKYQNALSGKIGGGIAVGGNRNGGQEFTLQQIHYYFLIHDMIAVGSGSVPDPGCYLGGGATTYPLPSRIRDSVLQDELGVNSCVNLGRKVASTIARLNG